MADATTQPMEPPGPTRPSTAVTVKGLRQIFVWPLALDLSAGGGVDDAVCAVAKQFDLHRDWAETTDLLEHLGPPMSATHLRSPDGSLALRDDGDQVSAQAVNDAMTYAEFVYFYDFLQRMIYADGGGLPPEDRPIRLWRHTRLREIEFALALSDGLEIDGVRTKNTQATYRAVVERLGIYLFDSGAAIVVLEIDFGLGGKVAADGALQSLSLADTLTICDHLRRVYTPFFKGSTAAKVPQWVVWHLAGASGGADERQPFTPKALSEDIGFVRGRRQSDGARPRHAPVAEHWRKILEPLVFAGYAEGNEPRWRHVLDERIPLMSFVSFTDAAHSKGIGPARNLDDWSAPENAIAQRCDFDMVTRGDWVRLCNADEAGTDALPYASSFLADFERTAVYDRFAADPDTTNASRILFAGYHFVVAGAGGFFDGVIVHHFRRHYFQMMMLANLELASLLVTSSRISQAVRLLHDKDLDHARAEFIDELESISGWFLTFVHRFRFSGVSNQIQPSELYDRMRASMKLDDLFVEVKEELEAAVAFNGSVEQRRITASGERLANVATAAAPVGLALTFLGMNAVIDPVREFLGAKAATDQVTLFTLLGAKATNQAPLSKLLGVELPVLIMDLTLTLLTIALFSGSTLLGLRFFLRKRHGGRASSRPNRKQALPIGSFLGWLAGGAFVGALMLFFGFWVKSWAGFR